MMYAETRNMTPYGNDGIANKTQNFEAVAQYQFDFGLRPSRRGSILKASIWVVTIIIRAMVMTMLTGIWLTISTWA